MQRLHFRDARSSGYMDTCWRNAQVLSAFQGLAPSAGASSATRTCGLASAFRSADVLFVVGFWLRVASRRRSNRDTEGSFLGWRSEDDV